MNSSTKIFLLILVLGAAIFVLIAQLVSVRHQTIKQIAYTTNAGELTRDVLVGQTFKSEQNNLSGVAAMFATYSNRRNTADVTFHLRQSFETPENLRTVSVPAEQLGDNQLYRFEFEPIPDSKDKTYFFFVVSPDSVPGNAVTVDVDTRNPYHLGSAFIVRGQGSDVTNAQVLAASGKPTQDIGFATFHTVPLRVAVVRDARQAVYQFLADWEGQRSRYLIMARVAIPAAIFLLMIYLVARAAKANPATSPASRTVLLVLLSLMAAGLVLRILYATQLPVTDDEGNYLYDARSLRQGILAGGDGYVKAPLFIVWVALWQAIFGDSVLAGRLSSIVIGTLTTIPIYILARQLKNKYAGLVAAAAWALLGATTLAHVYVHTQPVAIFFGLAGIALIWSTVTRFTTYLEPTPFHRVRLSTWRLVAGGMLLGLGVISRKSILALGIVPLLLVITYLPTWRQRSRALLAIGVGFAIVLAAFVGVAYWLYGPVGVYEALGIASAEDGQLEPEESEIAKVRSYSLRGMTPFFRESMPLILFSLLGWGYILESYLRGMLRTAFSQKPGRATLLVVDQLIPKVLWLLPLLAFWWCFSFFFEYEGEAFMFLGMPWLWYAMGGLLITGALWPRPQDEAFVFEEGIVAPSTQPLPPNVAGPSKKTRAFSAFLLNQRITPSIATILLLPIWLGGLGFFYVNWIKFHANYINEFLPPLVIFSGVGALLLWQRLSTAYWIDAQHPIRELVRKAAALAAVLIAAWSIFVSNYITYLYEHTGTFDQRAAHEAGTWARENIPLDQPIFTGAALIPYLSGHHTTLDISHPRWYAYEFTRKNPERLNVFLPPIEDMLAAYRSSQWFLLDKQTGFSFLMEYSEIEQGLERDWISVKGIENGSNTLTFYRRK